MEFFRDQAADQFDRHTNSAWRPRSGSKVNHRNLTSAMIDSRDFLAARRWASNEVLLPTGPRIAFTGGLDFNDHRLFWDKLDRVHVKHPDMVLLHGGSPKGAELIAATWADHRKVPQIAFKPDWTRPSNVTTRCSMCYRSGSCSSPAPAFRPIWPTRPRSSAFRSGNSGAAARERRLLHTAAHDPKPTFPEPTRPFESCHQPCIRFTHRESPMISRARIWFVFLYLCVTGLFQNRFVTPARIVRRSPNCGAPTPTPLPLRI